MTTEQKRIDACSAERGQDYHCPNCAATVLLRRGSFKVAHFAHRQNTGCHIGEPETQEHLAGKFFLWEQSQRYGTVQVEWYLDAIRQRPDVLVNHHLVLEFQCSPLSLTRFCERIQGYRSLELHSEWLLGRAYYLRRKTAASVLKFLAYRPTVGYYLLFLLEQPTRFVIRYQLRLVDQWLTFSEQSFSTGAALMQFLQHPQLTQPTVPSLRLFQEWVENQLQWKNPAVVKLQQTCYQKRHLLQGCPLICHVPRWVPPLQTAIWWLNWRIQILLELETNHSVNLTDLVQALESQLQFPLLDDLQQHVTVIVKQFANQLVRAGIVKQCHQQLYWQKNEHWFADGIQKKRAIRAKEKD
ncbi:hypothetical protein M3M38_06845 [Fructilactobacillus cliffordii]|uniref:competence protein CoiA n=1 Tax=Fructilactobacillus cliffordii TaxID=2940299 RepID=UPI002093FB23|nr:competence protein CoiA family protein [Fructilactobacillus cliffordii]USS86376.1 hypothetical protein M3M38_06845 [Fructilactobacillus cliffordii]